MTTLEDLQICVRETPLLERLNKCRDMIADMCKERRPPKMTIPVQWYNEDFYIIQTLQDAETQLAKEARTCCYIIGTGKPFEYCKNMAKYQIWYGLTPDDYTESCAAHLELLCPDVPHFHVTRIEHETP